MIASRLLAGALCLSLAVGMAACSGDAGGTAAPDTAAPDTAAPDTAAPETVAPVTAAPGTAAPETPAIASPLVGRVVAVDAQGLTKVRGFTVRTDAGAEIPFTIGVLENGAEFPPGHLAEHKSTASPIRVFFRDEGGERVVYRIEDAAE